MVKWQGLIAALGGLIAFFGVMPAVSWLIWVGGAIAIIFGILASIAK